MKLVHIGRERVRRLDGPKAAIAHFMILVQKGISVGLNVVRME